LALFLGNGTQSIVWQINEEAYREKLEEDAGTETRTKRNLQIYYGSVHDILSYPCEVRIYHFGLSYDILIVVLG
jgi:hypothetical protein